MTEHASFFHQNCSGEKKNRVTMYCLTHSTSHHFPRAYPQNRLENWQYVATTMSISSQATSVFHLKDARNPLQVFPIPCSAPIHSDTSLKWKLDQCNPPLNLQILFFWTKAEMPLPWDIHIAGPFTVVFALVVNRPWSTFPHLILQNYSHIIILLLFSVFSQHPENRKFVLFYWSLLP